MKYRPRFFGLVYAALTIAAIGVAIQALLYGVQAARAGGSAATLTGFLFTAALMSYLAALTARMSYRNLFWTRYVAAVRAQLDRTGRIGGPDED